MEIGKKLKEARVNSGLTQEQVAEKINVSRQTVSNWENEKSYPDIISIISLSDLYNVSLDMLLKGDENMIKHLEESTNTVRETRRLVIAIIINILFIAIMIALSAILPQSKYFLSGVFSLMIISFSTLFYLIIKRI